MHTVQTPWHRVEVLATLKHKRAQTDIAPDDVLLGMDIGQMMSYLRWILARANTW